ncbi:MAG: sarcosine oxidase subunit alpha family protein [Paracoccaceae bacterium]
MSFRLPAGGRLINSAKPLKFRFNGKAFEGFEGDTLASALMGSGQMLMGRSFKYHRPRGAVATGAEEPNALVGLGQGARFEPNQRATTTELFEGLSAQSQNHWPSLNFDVGALNARIARFLPAGFYYKTFMAPRAAWKHIFEPFIRKSAGLGAAPTARDADRYEHAYLHLDVLIIGGGIAGITAALAAAKGGGRVMLIEQTAHWGGRAPVDGAKIGDELADYWIKDAIEQLEKYENVTLMKRCTGAGIYDHGYALAYQRLSDHSPENGLPRHRLWRIRAGRIINAAGAIERPLSFAGNDIPGVMLASAMRDYLINWGVAVGQRAVIVTNNDDAYRTAIALSEAGIKIPAIIEARAQATGPLAQIARDMGIRILEGRGIAQVHGKKGVERVSVSAVEGMGGAREDILCDAVAMSGGWSPVVHLWSHCGGKLIWDDAQSHFRPDPNRPPLGADGQGFMHCAGAAAGPLETADILQNAHAAGKAAAQETGGKAVRALAPTAALESAQPMEPIWIMPKSAGPELRAKMWLDFQNDVKVSDVQLAAREGYESVEHTKRYTTLGMATDQGKLSNINGLAVLADALQAQIPQVGTTTFRPPYTPISMGAIAGEARGALFQPIRKTPIHDWHEAKGAYFEPVGQWHRPYCYPTSHESHAEAVQREVINTRENVGLLDASTLGKIIVKGPDAGRFLDMIYTNLMSSLPVGKCRYGLMCNENGFLIDDGVVARLSEDTFLCHTTTGGADRIHAHMEDWLQCEWWDWQVYTSNITEQYAQIAIVGPKARTLLEALGGMDVSRAALPFMQWGDGQLGGFGVRVFRISFSGELSYEIAVPAGQGRAFWEACLAAGAPLGMMPYGTEALHILRAEKGFIMIGDETDGTVIPQDLGLNWAISKKKTDYLGKRAQARSHMIDPARWRLVGLETLDGSVLPDGAYAVEPDTLNELGQGKMIGRVTSSYHSPNLGQGIAMGLVERGPERMGEVLQFPRLGKDAGVIHARICDPVFYDKDGAKSDA